MTEEQLKRIINNGENEGIEFKQSFGKAVIESLVAFSNTKGGKVLIGIKNDKSIIGVSITEETVQNWINEIKQNTESALIPDIDIYKIDHKQIVILRHC